MVREDGGGEEAAARQQQGKEELVMDEGHCHRLRKGGRESDLQGFWEDGVKSQRHWNGLRICLDSRRETGL